MGSTQHWDRYWQSSGSVNSFAESDVGLGYQGELLSLWHSAFAKLPKHAIIVDVGTGNGAIALAARQFSDNNQHAFTILGTDAANINPQLALQAKPGLATTLGRIRFLPQTHTEQLPFANNSIDFISSQFAFEYAKPTEALAECLRVLKPGASMQAIVHHTESTISADSRCGQAVLAKLLYDTPFFALAHTLFASLAKKALAPKDPALLAVCQNQNKDLLNLVQQLKANLGQGEAHWFDDALAKFAKLLMNFVPENMTRLQLFQAGLADFHLRLTEQLNAAYSAKQMQQFLAEAKTLSAAAKAKPLTLEQELFGWLVTIQK